MSRLTAALADRYRIERELGAGGMATVYLAEDLKHDRKVAVKVLRPELAVAIGAERFLVEIKTTANLQHPHILALHDSGAVDGTVFYVMPFIEGESLRDKLDRETQLPIDNALRIAKEVADALHYAHERGVIHRDIKPENILLQGGHAVVADFGIALAASKTGGSRMTETGMSLGTPTYMSPEQAMGVREVDARSDIYSLGCLLYEMIAGEPPFTGPSAQAIVAKVMTESPKGLTAQRRTVPANVDAAIATALEKLPADRFNSAKAFAEALENPAFTTQASAKTVGPRATGRTWWRDPRIAALVVVGLTVGAALAAVFTTTGRAPVAVEYDVGLPDSAQMYTPSQDVGFAVSPQGDFVVYETVRLGRSELWYRSLLDATVQRIPGTEDGSQPVVSPDGRRIAFIRTAGSEWTVEVLTVDGGTATTVGRSVGIQRKLYWPASGPILLLRSDENVARWLDPERGPLTSFPIRYCEAQALTPDADGLLCGGGGLKWAYRINIKDTTIEERLWTAEDSTRVFGSSFQIVDGKYLTYMSVGGDLLAAPVDLTTGRVGKAVRMASGVGLAEYTALGSYAIAASGTLVYAEGDNRAVGNLVHLTESGIDTVPVGREAFVTFEYSPDGRRLAAVVESLEGMELRIYDLSSGRYQTWFRRAVITHPVWSPQSDRLVFGANDSVFVGSPDRAGPPDFVLYQKLYEALRWMPDDKVYGIRFSPPIAVSMQLGQLPVTLDSLFADNGFFWPSADGRWIAYTNSAYTEAWIEPLPRDGRRYQAAAGNLADIQWLSGTELGVPITDGNGTRLERVTVDASANPPVRNRGLWANARRFRDTNGPSFATAPGGGVIYL